MHTLAVGDCPRTVDGRPDQRMGELHAKPHLGQTGIHRGPQCRQVDAQDVRNAAQKHRVAQRLRGCGEKEQLGVRRQKPKALHVAASDSADHRLAGGQSESACHIRAPCARQPAGLSDDERSEQLVYGAGWSVLQFRERGCGGLHHTTGRVEPAATYHCPQRLQMCLPGQFRIE